MQGEADLRGRRRKEASKKKIHHGGTEAGRSKAREKEDRGFASRSALRRGESGTLRIGWEKSFCFFFFRKRRFFLFDILRNRGGCYFRLGAWNSKGG